MAQFDQNVQIMAVWKPGGLNFTILGVGDNNDLTIVSAVEVDPATGEPTQVFVVPDLSVAFLSFFVLECQYSGNEFMAEVSLSSGLSPLQIDREVSQGPQLTPMFKQQLANQSQPVLGTNLERAFVDAGYNIYSDNNTDMAFAIGSVLSYLGEAYISILRQEVERTTLSNGQVFGDLGAKVEMYAVIQRVGGAQFAWLAILVALFLGTLPGLVRVRRRKPAVKFDAQNAVTLLAKLLQDEDVSATSRVRYDNTVEVIRGSPNVKSTSKEAHVDVSNVRDDDVLLDTIAEGEQEGPPVRLS